MMGKIPITIIMLTLNEEFHLPGAIENVKDWAEEIFIVDSLSTDKTVDIALEYGVNIVQRPFTNFGDQWNFALQRLPIKTPWIFKLDPDERLSDSLKEEIASLLAGNPSCCGYEMDRRLWFMGKPLHVLAPVLRLWKTGTCRFSDVLVNEHPLVDGPVGKLQGIMEHFDSRDLHHWWEKQNRYTTLEAIMQFRGDNLSVKPNLFGSSLQRRMFFKKYLFKMPFYRYFIWVYELFIRGAIRDGIIGWQWVSLRVNLSKMQKIKLQEMKNNNKILYLPKHPNGTIDCRIKNSSLQKLVTLDFVSDEEVKK